MDNHTLLYSPAKVQASSACRQLREQAESVQQTAAAEEAAAAYQAVEERIAALHAHPAPRALNCGTRSPTLHLRRDRDGGRVEDALIHTSCGRSDCPHCWRRRITRTYRREATCLLYTEAEKLLPRAGALYLAETDWASWEALDKSIRREHGGAVGRLRIRRTDGTVLVVCAQPLRGGRTVTPAEACDLASGAVGQLSAARHAYRQLGDWSDSGTTEWRLIARLPGTLDFAKVADRLLAAGRKSRQFRTAELSGLVWRVESEAAAVRLELLLSSPQQACPTLAPWEDRDPKGPKSDTPPPPSSGGGGDFNPVDSPWG